MQPPLPDFYQNLDFSGNFDEYCNDDENCENNKDDDDNDEDDKDNAQLPRCVLRPYYNCCKNILYILDILHKTDLHILDI